MNALKNMAHKRRQTTNFPPAAVPYSKFYSHFHSLQLPATFIIILGTVPSPASLCALLPTVKVVWHSEYELEIQLKNSFRFQE